MSGDGRGVDMSAAAIGVRVREMSALSDLSPQTRLDAKIDMSPEGIMRRLREVSELLTLCRKLEASTPVVVGRTQSTR